MGACTSKPSVAAPTPPPPHAAAKGAAPPAEPGLPDAAVSHQREALAQIELSFLAGSALGAKVVEVLESGDALPAEDGTAGPVAALLFRMYDADHDGLLNDAELSAALHAFAVHAHTVASHAGPVDVPPTEEELAEVVASLRSQLVRDPQHPGVGVSLAALTAWLEGVGAEGAAADGSAAGDGGPLVEEGAGEGAGHHAHSAEEHQLYEDEGGAHADAPAEQVQHEDDHGAAANRSEPPPSAVQAQQQQQQSHQQLIQQLQMGLPSPMTPARRVISRGGGPGLPSLTPTSTAAMLQPLPPPYEQLQQRETSSSVGEDPPAASGSAGEGRVLVPDGGGALVPVSLVPGAAAAALFRRGADAPPSAAYGGAVAAY